MLHALRSLSGGATVSAVPTDEIGSGVDYGLAFGSMGLSGSNRRTIAGPPHPVRIGVVWRGKPHLESDRIRSIPFAVYTPFLNRLPMIPLVSLQHGDHTSEERDLLGVYAVKTLNRAEFDYLDTANVMATLDLVITVNTSVAHLAAAMGKPVWLLNRATSEWLRVGRPRAHPGIPTTISSQDALLDCSPVLVAVYNALVRNLQTP